MRFRASVATASRFSGIAFSIALAGPIALPPVAFPGIAAAQTTVPSDAELARSLPGDFVSDTKVVNGVRLHYVAGGQGEPLFLLPGWPQTWWEFRKIMPELAKTRRVVAVDIRGMGRSDKPREGYDKKTMAADMEALAASLGYDRIDIAGHDIGAMVAYAFAANHPERTGRIALIDVAHPDESLYDLTLLPPAGQPAVGSGDATHPVYLWWFALNQIPDLPEALLAGRMRLLIDWLFDTQLADRGAIGGKDRDVYAAAYGDADAVRAGNAWYQAFRRDIEDQKAYGPIAAPMLVLAGERNYPFLRTAMPAKGRDVRVMRIEGSSHYVPEDRPAETAAALDAFFRR